MTIYIDENMPSSLAEGLNILQQPLNFNLKENIEVKSVKETFGQGVKDEDWLPTAGEQGACVITQDYNMKRLKHQNKLCQEHGLGMFFFRPPSKCGFSYMNMLKLIIKHWEGITTKACRQKKPFGFRITSKGKMEPL